MTMPMKNERYTLHEWVTGFIGILFILAMVPVFAGIFLFKLGKYIIKKY